MSGYPLDTNIPSEMTRPRPSRQVVLWLDQAEDNQLFLSVISIAEILRGIHRLPENAYRLKLQRWLDETLRPWFAGRILPVTQPIAERAGRVAGERDKLGLTVPGSDGLIAATALEHNLTLVTRNIKDFTGPGVPIVNPWNPWNPSPPEVHP